MLAALRTVADKENSDKGGSGHQHGAESFKWATEVNAERIDQDDHAAKNSSDGLASLRQSVLIGLSVTDRLVAVSLLALCHCNYPLG